MTVESQQEQVKIQEIPKQKAELRILWRSKRKEISLGRRQDAAASASPVVSRISEKHQCILSYASFGDEFCTLKINQHLAIEGKLLLPRVDKNQLKIFHVNDPSKQLSENSWGIREPIPSICQEADPNVISYVLVPGLAFDSRNHRLGYGKGLYDGFLTSLPTKIHASGIGFKEQYHPDRLPTTPTDIPLKGLLLF